MRGFWAVALLVIGLFLFYPGMFIWPFGLLSMAMLLGSIIIAVWDEQDRKRPIVLIFAWTGGFLLLIEVGFTIFVRFFL